MLYSISINNAKNRLKAISKINDTSANYLHIDVMDGKFVKNTSFTISEILKADQKSNLPLDVHLMVNNPLKYIEKIALCNLKYITFHYEAVKDPKDLINAIKNTGVLVGMSIKPKTKVKEILEYLPLLDQILVMSVEPGKSGQTFIKATETRINYLREYITTNNLKTIIAVDGGVNDETISYCSHADMVIMDSYINNSDNYQGQLDNITNVLNSLNNE